MYLLPHHLQIGISKHRVQGRYAASTIMSLGSNHPAAAPTARYMCSYTCHCSCRPVADLKTNELLVAVAVAARWPMRPMQPSSKCSQTLQTTGRRTARRTKTSAYWLSVAVVHEACSHKATCTLCDISTGVFEHAGLPLDTIAHKMQRLSTCTVTLLLFMHGHPVLACLSMGWNVVQEAGLHCMAQHKHCLHYLLAAPGSKHLPIARWPGRWEPLNSQSQSKP